MEAKDTVIKPDELGQAIIKHPKLPMGQAIAIEQAEISFKAGEEEEYRKWVKAFMRAGILIAEADTVGVAVEETKRAGIREVVEWVDKCFELKQLPSMPDHTFYYELHVLCDVWQAKLKEWGIE